MDIIISHKSALEYWRLDKRVKNINGIKLRSTNLPTSLPRTLNIRERVPSGLTYPINVMVSSENANRKSSAVKAHVHAGKTPDGCVINIGDGLGVSAPSFVFFQMASELPIIKLIELGFEFCGTYSKPAVDNYKPGVESADKTVYGLPALTSTKALKAFTAHMENVHGHKNSIRALRYIAAGSASPMETIIFILLTLPHKLGGYGLPMPEFNKRIDLMTTYKNKRRKTYYVCDLFWQNACLSVEYDSDYYHTGADRIASDSKRRFDLTAHGVTVITVTTGQIRSETEFDSLAKLIAGKLQKRLRYDNPQQFLKAKRELRKLLL